MFGEEDFEGVSVDAARKFVNDPLFRRVGITGGKGIALPI
jgi:hypothetical protein